MLKALAWALIALLLSMLPEWAKAGQPELSGRVGINFVPGKDGWSGQILTEDGSALAATISLANASRLDLKVCVMAVFCDATSYWRVAP